MSTFRIILILLIFGPALLFPQQGSESSNTHHCEALDQKGWTVPGLAGAKIQARGPSKYLDGVFLSVLEPGDPEAWLIGPECPAATDKAPEFRARPIRVMKLWGFDAGGAPFAYRIEYADEALHRDGTRGELGSMSVVYFFDTSGSGRFTLVRASTMIGKNYFFPDIVPEWAKRPAAPKPAQ